jgi:hypothetical protein
MRWSRGSFSASVGSTWSCGRCSGRSRRIAKLAARPRWRRFASRRRQVISSRSTSASDAPLIGGREMRVYFFVAVLGYSRRIYVRAFLRERHDDWREGLAGAFVHFGGVTQTVLVDNARALILGRDSESGVVHVHPAFSAFCVDWGVAPRACRPYRARTKGKTESGVGYVKRNAIAGRSFDSFAALEAHLATWIVAADTRIHGTTHERPLDRFERAERQALRPLPARPLPVRQQRLSRRVPTDAFVDVETVRYSVPHRLVRRTVEVLLGDDEVVIFDGRRGRRATSPRSRAIHARRGAWPLRGPHAATR